MSEFMRQAQAPTNSNPEAAPVASTDTPDHVQHDGETFDNTPLQQAVDQGFIGPVPDSLPHHVTADPGRAAYRELPPQAAENRQGLSKNSVRVLAALGGAAGAAVVGVGALNFLSDDNQEQLNTPPVPAVSADTNENLASGRDLFDIPGLKTLDLNNNGVAEESEDFDLMPPTQFSMLPLSMRVNDVAPKLNAHLGATLDLILEQPNLSADQIMALREPKLNLPREQWSDQDYLSNHTLSLYLVSAQEDIEEGQRALSVVVNPDDRIGFENRNDIIGDGVGLLNIYKAVEHEFSGQNIPNGTNIDGIHVTENGGRYVKAQILSDSPDQGEYRYMLFTNHTDEDGNEISMLERIYTSPDNPVSRVLKK